VVLDFGVCLGGLLFLGCLCLWCLGVMLRVQVILGNFGLSFLLFCIFAFEFGCAAFVCVEVVGFWVGLVCGFCGTWAFSGLSLLCCRFAVWWFRGVCCFGFVVCFVDLWLFVYCSVLFGFCVVFV